MDGFEIMGLLQFQDITRQKTDRVILLLKEMEKRLNRLLVIFNIDTDMKMDDDEKQRPRVSEHIEDVNLFKADAQKDDVDAIIDQFLNEKE